MALSLSTKIFLDSGDPKETRGLLSPTHFLQGQTTNPSLVAKNPDVRERIQQGKTFSTEELLAVYKKIVQEISGLLPDGSVSIEVYADEKSSADDLFKQGREFFSWIPNAHIKYPITAAGLEAASRGVAEGMRVNMTLCFSQEQAAAVYAATKGAKRGDVFISPFIGRLDDHGEDGLMLVQHIKKMFEKGDGHVQVLAASVRSFEHLYSIFSEKIDIATVPYALLRQWFEKGMPLSDTSLDSVSSRRSILYKECSLSDDWRSRNIQHDLTDAGLKKFAEDWNNLLR